MADPYTPLFDESPDPFDPANPFAPRVLKQTLGRKPTPLGGQHAVDQGDQYRQAAIDLLKQAQANQPSEEDTNAMRSYAQQRDLQARRDFVMGTAMSMGGSAFQPIGAQVLRQALAAQGPEKIGGGIVQGGQFFTDPEVTAQRRQSRLEAQAKIYESMAANASTVAGREQAAQLAAQAHADARAATEAQQQANRDQRVQQQTWHAEDNARNHFDQITKESRDLRQQISLVKAMPTDGKLSPVQQQSLIVLLNKFQDPGSVVREGEFNRVAAAQGLLQRWGNLPQMIMTGRPLPPALVRDIQSVINLYADANESYMRRVAGQYIDNARQRGLDPSQVVTDRSLHPVQQQPGRGVDVGARLNPSGAPNASGRTQVDY